MFRSFTATVAIILFQLYFVTEFFKRQIIFDKDANGICVIQNVIHIVLALLEKKFDLSSFCMQEFLEARNMRSFFFVFS